MSGLEVIGIVASIIQVADAGLKLGDTIHTYASAVASAGDRLDRIATHVKVTSSIVREVGCMFEKHSPKLSAVSTAEQCVKECESVFVELDSAVVKARFVDSDAHVKRTFNWNCADNMSIETANGNSP